MGASESIEIINNGTDIFEIKDKKYPIAYIRLYHDKIKNKFCILSDCDRDSTETRKFIVVGMRLGILYPDIYPLGEIYEQVFYTTSGLNSLSHIEEFFQSTKKSRINYFDIKTDYSKYSEMTENEKLNNCLCWLPFSGLGYDSDRNTLKLLKDNYCVKKKMDCEFGRFGKQVPNLMQISYCLSGLLWDKYYELFHKTFDIQKLPTLRNFIEKIDCYYSDTSSSPLECMINVNKYIGPAIYLNYIPKTKVSPILTGIKIDYNIIYKLLDYPNNFTKFKFKNGLPIENRTFLLPSFNHTYYGDLLGITNNNMPYFLEHILPISEKVFVKDKEEITTMGGGGEISSREIAEILKGSRENPHEKREDARIDDYYYRGKNIFQKHK